MAINREAMLAVCKRRYVTVDVPGVGDVRLQSLSELERSQYELAALDNKNAVSREKLLHQRCRLIALCVVDDEGKRLFSDDDVRLLLEMDSQITNAIFDAAQLHCGFTKADIEALEKNC